MRFEYRVEKKVSKKERERETSGCNFFQNKRAFIGLESWYFILPGKARNSCIAVQKSGGKVRICFKSSCYDTMCDDTMVTRGQGWAWKQGPSSVIELQAP